MRALPRLASDQILERGRQNAFTKVKALLNEYDLHCDQAQVAEADEIRCVLVEEPFSAVFASILHSSGEPGAADVFEAELLAILNRRPEVHQWLKEADDARKAIAEAEIAVLANRMRTRRPQATEAG